MRLPLHVSAVALLSIALSTLSCSGPEPDAPRSRDTRLPVERRVSGLMSRMRPDEKRALVRGAKTLSMTYNSRLGIPALRAVAGVMGISAKDESGQPILATAFPANIGMAATWNPALLEQAGVVIAQQARALGRGQILGPLADISRSPLSGRVFETYGEDPWLASRLVIGYISGLQGEGEIATAIFKGGTTGTRAAREFDVWPVEAAVSEAGAWAVMPEDGNPISGFLDRLGFRGFTVLNRPDEAYAGSDEALDGQVRGILRALFASGVFDRDAGAAQAGIETVAHRIVARAAAGQSIVLLKNAGGLLPLDKNKVHSLAVFGPNADVNRMAAGNYTVAARYSATPLAALRAIYGSGVVFAAKSPAEAARADAAIVFAGTGMKTEAEMRDRTSLNLPPGQDELIEAVERANPRTVVVVNSGSAIAMNRWIARVPAVLEAWFPGEEGGNAIADVLTGAVNPSGRLPITFPARMEDLHGGDLSGDAGIYPGYRHFDRNAIEPLFPFGYGLSYTQFEYTGLTVEPAAVSTGQFAEIGVTVRNAGSRAGRETVQLYLRATHSATSVERAFEDLRGFQQVCLKPGESKHLTFTLTPAATSYFDEKQKDWVQDDAVFEVRVGSSSRDIRATGTFSISE